MGGLGSGRPKRDDSQRLVGQFVSVDIRSLPAAFALGVGRAPEQAWNLYGRGGVPIRIEHQDDRLRIGVEHRTAEQGAVRVSQAVRTTSTPCAYGGERAWFVCPDCGRRAAILYWRDLRFSCRRCLRLAYPSQRESVDLRAARRLARIRQRLKWPPGFLHLPGDRPRGMHKRTFLRLVAEHNALLEVVGQGLSNQVTALSELMRSARIRARS